MNKQQHRFFSRTEVQHLCHFKKRDLSCQNKPLQVPKVTSFLFPVFEVHLSALEDDITVWINVQ